jgi:hypothetical protein
MDNQVSSYGGNKKLTKSREKEFTFKLSWMPIPQQLNQKVHLENGNLANLQINIFLSTNLSYHSSEASVSSSILSSTAIKYIHKLQQYTMVKIKEVCLNLIEETNCSILQSVVNKM